MSLTDKVDDLHRRLSDETSILEPRCTIDHPSHEGQTRRVSGRTLVDEVDADSRTREELKNGADSRCHIQDAF